MPDAPIEIVADPETLALRAQEHLARAGRDAARVRGRFLLVLSGGGTPRRLYGRLAAADRAEAPPWEATVLLFGDERCVPPDHPDSNYRMVRESLLDGLPAAPAVLRIEGEREPGEAAARYEAALRGLFAPGSAPRLDLVLLGVGADGHTASLFPGEPALGERSRWVAAARAPRGAPRVTLTLPALESAREVLFLVSGEDKAEVVAEAFGGRPHAPPHPCERVRPRDGVRRVLADRAAARLLTEGLRAGGPGR